MIINVCWSLCKLSYSCQILIKLEFPGQIKKNIQLSNFMKIRPVGGELFHADGQTDMTKLIVAFRNFANAPKIEHLTKGSVIHAHTHVYWKCGMFWNID